MVRIHPDPPPMPAKGAIKTTAKARGAVAQLGEHLLCKQGVVGSIPISSTTRPRAVGDASSWVAPIDCTSSAVFNAARCQASR